MDRFKSVFASRTIIANFITFVASIAVIWGVEMTMEQQAVAVSVIVGIGTAVSSYFRGAATKQLTVGDTTKIVPALVMFTFLAGCQTTQTPAVIVTPGVTRVDVAIGNASAQVAEYCTYLRVGVQIAPSFARTDLHHIWISRARAAVITYCDSPFVDAVTAVQYLINAYRAIQAVPGVSPEVRAIRARML